MKKSAVYIIQARLKELGHYTGAIDGERGPLTHAAVLKALQARAGDLPTAWQEWSDKRQAIAFLQLFCHDKGINAGTIDGWWGPQTDFAFDSLQTLLETGSPPDDWRDLEPLDVNPHHWPQQTQSALTAFYGPHGEKDGFTPPLIRVECPWELKIAWNQNQKTRRIACHEKVADSLGRTLTRIHTHYGEAEIDRLRLNLYGGSYNPRKMRGGSNWSTHSWGIALDWDPEHNQLKWMHDQASLASSDYDDWWRFWEEEGWVSLGRSRNFDWMHVQAAKL